MRYVVPLLALVLFLALIPRGDAGPLCDRDHDGVGDCTGTGDNCSVHPNGPLAQDPQTPQCDTQLDGDMDGYGNPCDSDVDNDLRRVWWT
jgi:hypothetical protein